MAMKKTSPKKTEPKPPTPRQSAKTSTKSPAKKASPAAGMGRQAAAKGSKETSAKTRGMAAAYKKSGSGYLKSASKSQSGDLGAPNIGQLKGFFLGSPEYRRTRTEQRETDQDKRAKTKSGKGYLRPAENRATFESPYFLSKFNDLSSERTSQRAKDQAKRKKK